MPDFNDVVRHVILRIVVDSAGMAEELAKARAQLKGQEQAERESNKARAKDAEQVTKAFEKQNDAIRENIAAHDQLSKASDKNAQTTSERMRQSTKDIQDSSKAQIAQIKAVEDAKDRAHKRDLDRYKAEQAARLAYDKGIAESAERMAREQQRFNDERSVRRQVTTDENIVRQATRPTRIETQTHSLQENARRATSVADTAGYEADRAKADALNAADQRINDSVRRRQSLLADEKRARQELVNLTHQGEILEQRALEVSQRRAQSTGTRARTARGLLPSLGYAATASGDALIGGLRAVTSAPRSAARAGREFDAREFDEAGRAANGAEKLIAKLFNTIGDGSTKATVGVRLVADSIRNLGALQPRARTGDFTKSIRVEAPLASRALDGLASIGSKLSGVFTKLGNDAEGNVRRVQKLRAMVTGFFEDINRARAGGQGGSLLGDIVGKSVAGLQALDGAFSGVGRHLISFQNLIFLVVAAFGPLAAILGAVGAAALGLASNLVSLAGSLAALPGLISAAVAGFGVLALVIKPLTNVFSAYSAATKAAAKGSDEASRAAVTAANAVQDAQRRLTDATIAHTRAVEDAPRAERKLADARKQAKRDIEDLSAAYRKLKFDEEGAQLDVDASKQSYKRALVDPTATLIDRRQAQHAYEGALFDQQDQKTNAQRTREDYKEAVKLGVDGSDAVVEASRALQDASRAVADTLTAQTRAQQDLNEALLDQKAGGSAARTAMDAYKAELAKLSPEARKVAEAIIGLSDSWKAFQKRLETKVFGPLSQDTGKFKDVLGELESFLGPTADAFGGLADKVLKLLTNPEWKAFFASQGDANGRVIQSLGDAAIDAANGFKTLMIVAQPFVDFITDGIKSAAASFDEFFNSTEKLSNGMTKGEEGRKKFAGFLDIAKQRLSEVGTMIKNLVAGFAGFFTALNTGSGGKEDFTSWFNKGLIGATESFKKLGQEAANPNSGFRKWLERVKPLLSEIGTFLGKVVDFAGNLFSNQANLDEAKALLTNIGDALKEVAGVFDNLSKTGIISKVADAIKSMAGTIDTIGDKGGFKALSIFGDSLKAVASAVDLVVSALAHIPGLLTGIGVVIGTLFGAALVAKITKPIIGLVQFGRDAIRSIPNPANSAENDPTNTKSPKNSKTLNEPGTVGRKGGPGSRGNTSDTTVKDPDKQGNIFTRGFRKYRNATDQDAPTTPISVDRRDKTTGAKSTSSTKPGIFSTIRQNTKDAILGDTKVEPTLGRMEVLLRQIEINTRRSGGSTGSRGTGSGGGGGGGGKPTRPTGAGGSTRSSRRTTSTLPTLFDEDTATSTTRSSKNKPSVTITDPRFPGRPTVNPTTGGTQADVDDDYATTGSPYSKASRTDTQGVRTSTSVVREKPVETAMRLGSNRIRAAAGLPPLPDTYDSPRKTKTTTINSPMVGGESSAVTSFPVDPNGARGRAERLQQVQSARRTRTGSTSTPLTGFNQPFSQQQRREAVAASRAAREQGAGTVPLYDARGNRRSVSTVEGDILDPVRPSSAREVRTTRVIDGESSPTVAGELTGSSRRRQLTAPDDDTPALTAGRSQRELTSTGSMLALASGAPVKPKRDRFGRFRKTTAEKPVLPRDESGRFRKSTAEESRLTQERDPKTGRFVKNASDTAPVRDSKGRFAKIRDRLKGDSGSVGTFGLLKDEDEYSDGYNDGLNAAGGGSGGGKQSRKEKRAARKAAKASRRGKSTLLSLGEDLGEDLLDDEFDGDSGSSRRDRSTGTEGEGKSRRGGRLGRLGSKLGGLGGRLGGLGGGLGRGLIGGGIAAVAGGVLQMGGDALVNKFVKNDKDKESLSKGLSSVTTGASIGAIFGPAGAAVGGALGGIYALFKDKNLRDFVGNKLGQLGKIIVDGLKAAGSWIANFFTKTIPSWWSSATKPIGHFFSDTLPGFFGKVGSAVGHFFVELGKKAVAAGKWLINKFVDFLKFWYIDLPLTVLKFFGKLAVWAGQGVAWLLGKFVDFLKFWYVDLPLKVLGFFGKLAGWAAEGVKWLLGKFVDFLKFWYITLPEKVYGFFGKLGSWALDAAKSVGKFFLDHMVTPLVDFFTKKIPGFFTKDIPDAIKGISGFIDQYLIQPLKIFFGKVKDAGFAHLLIHPTEILSLWKDSVAESITGKHMSGGFVKGVYQGIEDKAKVLATPGEFFVRRSVAQKPENKAFLQDFNEGRIDVSTLYGGLAAATAPQVASIVPPDAAGLTGKVPTVVNTTINHAPLMGDVTIHNPVREKSEYSLRRRLEISANRHRR